MKNNESVPNEFHNNYPCCMILLFGMLIFLAIVLPFCIYGLAELGDAFRKKY